MNYQDETPSEFVFFFCVFFLLEGIFYWQTTDTTYGVKLILWPVGEESYRPLPIGVFQGTVYRRLLTYCILQSALSVDSILQPLAWVWFRCGCTWKSRGWVCIGSVCGLLHRDWRFFCHFKVDNIPKNLPNAHKLYFMTAFAFSCRLQSGNSWGGRESENGLGRLALFLGTSSFMWQSGEISEGDCAQKPRPWSLSLSAARATRGSRGLLCRVATVSMRWITRPDSVPHDLSLLSGLWTELIFSSRGLKRYPTDITKPAPWVATLLEKKKIFGNCNGNVL